MKIRIEVREPNTHEEFNRNDKTLAVLNSSHIPRVGEIIHFTIADKEAAERLGNRAEVYYVYWEFREIAKKLPVVTLMVKAVQ
jgi:hypothetical protein